MSYSQKIKNLLQKMKQRKNYNNNNSQQNINISRNFVVYKNNIPLIDDCSNNNKKFLFKKNSNKYQKSNHNSNNNSRFEYTKYFENNKKKDKFNNNFIVETNYEKNKTKINESNKININNSFRNNFNVNNITYQNTGKNYLNNNSIGEEKNLLKYKISHINTNNKNISHIYSSYHKIKNLNNSDYDIPNKLKIELNKENSFSSKNNKKKRISSYILKDRIKEIKPYTNNTSPVNYSSYYSKKKLNKNPKLNNDNNYVMNVNNNSYKNITSRIIKRDTKSLSELFDKERNIKKNVNVNGTRYKNIKGKLLINDNGYNFIYENKYKRNKFKRNCNSSSNLQEKDNHSGGKIILVLDENSLKRKSRKIKTLKYYSIKIQSFWRGYSLRKLVKITKELFLLFFPFINKLRSIFDKYKKQYVFLLKKNINQYYSKNKNIENKRIIKKNKIIYKNKNEGIMRKNITTPLLNKGQKTNINENKIDSKISKNKQIKIDNIFYHKKKLIYNKSQNNKYQIKKTESKRSEPNIKTNYNINNYQNKRLIKRASYKKFNNVSPDFRNIELNINNSTKKSLYDHRNNLNNYSSSISIFFQTQFPESKMNSLQNLVYINKNKNQKYNMREELFKKIKMKIFNNFYLIIYKCVKKSAYRFYWNKLCFQIKQNKMFIEFNNKKRNRILKSIINNITNKIKKNYFRKYRENILVEIVKTKLFYLTDYSNNKNNIFYCRHTNLLSKDNNIIQKLFEIYLKNKIKNIKKDFFSQWKMNIYNSFIKIEYPLSSTRSKYSKASPQNYIKKTNNYNINEYNDLNKKEDQPLIYKKNNNINYIKKYERSPIKKNYTQSQSYACTFYSPYNNIKYSKKNITNQNSILFNEYRYIGNKKIDSRDKIITIFDKINNKNMKNKYFCFWRNKRDIKKRYYKVKYKLYYFRIKFLKYFLLSLNDFLRNNNSRINNINKIGLSLFIWHRKTFIISK